MNREKMKELAEAQFLERQAATTIVHDPDDPTGLVINDRAYRIVENYRDALKEPQLAARFSYFLEKYDFILGDIASEQLRLRGFYRAGTAGVARSQQITALNDYLYETVNFGAPYFVLENLAPHAIAEEEGAAKGHQRRHRGRRHRGKGKGHQEKAELGEQRRPARQHKPGSKGQAVEVKAKGKRKQRHFEVRERVKETKETTK